jgi:arginyl-tRNA synthetase
MKKIFDFDKIIYETSFKYKPHILAQYIFDLAQKFSIFYMNTPKIIEENNKDLKSLRIKIIENFCEVTRL